MNINLRNALTILGTARERLDVNKKPRIDGALDPRCQTGIIDAAFYDISSVKDCLETLRHQLEDLER